MKKLRIIVIGLFCFMGLGSHQVLALDPIGTVSGGLDILGDVTDLAGDITSFFGGGSSGGGFGRGGGRAVFSGPGIKKGAAITESKTTDSISKEHDLKKLIIGWTNLLFSVIALLAVVALVWAGFLYITSMGDDSKMETAKKIIIWVVIGLILLLGAYPIVNTLITASF